MKMKFKRFLSGVMAVATLASVAVQPVAVSAAEAEPEPVPFEQQYPELKEVRDSLEADEIVTANDIEVFCGEEFEVEVDLTGIDGVDESKIKVLFHEAKNETGQEFDTHKPDTYKAVYAVKPSSGHSSYRISRNITVKEPEGTSEPESGGSTKEPEADDDDPDSEKEPETEKKSFYEMSYEEVLEAGAALVDKAVKSEDYETTFQGEELELYNMYQSMLLAGNDDRAMPLADADTLVVRNAKNGSGQWNLPLLDYLYSSETGDRVHNYVKYIANDAKNGWRLAYCLQISKHFMDSTQYIGKEWKKNGMYAEISYAIANGCKKYGQTNKAAYSTGNWLRDYYVTQAVIYCILEDYGYDGHSIKSLSAVSGYQDVYDCVKKMYKDVKKNGNNAGDGYGDNPEYTIVAPDSTSMKLNSEGTYYQTGWYSVKSSGELKSRSLSLSGEPEGAEIVYKDSNSNTSPFYIRIPVDKAHAIGDRAVNFKVKATAKFARPVVYTYQSKIADAQNVTFLEKKTTNAPKTSEALVSIKLDKAKIEVVKVDSKKPDVRLAGAVFGIYKDRDCTQLITKMPETDSKGYSVAEIIKTQDTVFLKEITAPKGYRVNTASYHVKLVEDQTASIRIADEEQLGQLTVYKEGQVLTGAVVSEDGTAFQYENRRQKGAVYNVYAGEDIVSASGATVYSKGDLVKERLSTDENGACTMKNLYLGTYIVKEMQAPENFYNGGEEKKVTLSYSGQNEEVVFSDVTFINDRQKADVSVVKKDKDTDHPLAGGIFALYAGNDITNADGMVVVKKGTLIEKATTDADGKVTFTADLPVGFSYLVKEVQAPEGYLRNSEDSYAFTFSYTNDSEPKVSFSHTFVNERVKASISLEKKDAEKKQAEPQGDATLEKAVYGLYARKDIIHPDGTTGVLFKAGEQVATLTTDQNGRASVENLYLGDYYVKEISPSVGYLADKTEYDLVCSYEGDMVAEVKHSCISLEQVMKQPFQIIKAANNGETDAELLAGAGFRAYLESSLKKKADGSYDFDSATPVVIGENGATEMFTDEKGYACSIALPYGTYIVRETTTPHNYKPVDDFIVRITENHPNTPQEWRVLLDKEFEAKLKIVKQDDETKKPVLQKDTEFKIYDLKRKKYVEQVTTYPTTVTHKSFFTDNQGYLILPQNLKIGKYRIEEVHAPLGYTLNENYYEVTVDSNTAYQMDGTSGDVVIEVVYENHPVKGKLTIVKKGEVLDGFKDDFTYQADNLKGAEFQIYAAEDIYTADFQKDENGNRILEYAAGTLIKTVTTDQDGKAVLENLPLGSYKIVETAAPEGFVLSSEAQKVTFSYKDQETPVIEQTAVIENDRQKVEVSVVKQDAGNETPIAGAEFGLYAKKDIEAQGTVIVKADTLLGKAVSDEKGKAVFTQDMPFGEYYIRELKAPKGYVLSDEVLEVKAEYEGQDVKVVQVSSVFKNQPTKVVVSKSDLTTGVELSGATLTVLDRDGKIVDTWKSVKGEQHLIERLSVGETYTLCEEMAPYGYLKAEEITFTIKDTGESQKVEMKDDVPKGTIIINKNGEFLEKVTPLDSVGGWISHLFQYVAGNLSDVTFEVYALEDVKAADGESEDYYKKDELVATITTDAAGIAKVSDLPLGKYYVKEKSTVDGFILDEKAREIDLTYRNQDTAEVTYSSDWQNNRQKAEVEVLKKAKGSDRMLEGAVFALCAKEDITGTDGKVILKADTMIEELATDKDGKLIFTADLPIGFTYYIKETSPAPGFVTTEKVQEFTFDYEGPEKEKVSYSFTFENEPTKIQISKTDISGKELPGAKLTILDKDGKVMESWTSGKEPHYIEMLPIGEYTLHEESAPEGYLVAEDVKFTVKDTGEIQKVVMKDEAEPEGTPEKTPTPGNPSSQVTDTPKTGDETHMLLWILLAIAGLAGTVSAVWVVRKKE